MSAEDGFSTMQKLQRATKIFNIWTIITILILTTIVGLHYIYPTILNENLQPGIVYVIVYLLWIVFAYLYNWRTKDIQKAIAITVLRLSSGFILPIPLMPLPLIGLAVSVYVQWIGIALFLISLIMFALIYPPFRKLLYLPKEDLQKQ